MFRSVRQNENVREQKGAKVQKKKRTLTFGSIALCMTGGRNTIVASSALLFASHCPLIGCLGLISAPAGLPFSTKVPWHQSMRKNLLRTNPPQTGPSSPGPKDVRDGSFTKNLKLWVGAEILHTPKTCHKSSVEPRRQTLQRTMWFRS